MGKEKAELNENKLSNQSDHSPVREATDHDEERVPLENGDKKAVHIPNGKGVSISVTDEKNHTTTNIGALEKRNKNGNKDKYEMVPPDGGWGWFVLFGSMLINILVPGTIKSFGVLFVEFQEAFQSSPAESAWIPALCYFLYSSLGPLSSILSVKYSYRTVVFIGGTFAAVGMIITYWATSIGYLYVSYGVFVGTGAGLSFPPTVYIVTSYFVKLRGLANGLCISGSALGSIFLPPLLRYLLENYGYRGACMIMGGITLNTWIAALFYEPVERHMKKVLKKDPENEDDFEFSDDRIIEETESEDEKQRTPLKAKFVITGDDTPAGTPTLEHKTSDIFRFPLKNDFARSVSAAAVQNFIKPNHEESHRQRKISTPIRQENRNITFMSGLSSNDSVNMVQSFSSNRLSRFQRLSVTRPPKRSPSTSSFQYISTPFHGGSFTTMQPNEFSSYLSLNSLNPVSSCVKRQPQREQGDGGDAAKPEKKFKFIDLSLLTDPTYLVILISNSTNAISYTNFIILLPSYAITMGFDKGRAAYLLSIVSALDLIGRIGGSALSDTNLMPKTYYYFGGLLISGISLALLPFFTTYSMISFCCAVFGLSSGTYVGITAVIMADMLGTERLTSTYGISLFVNGILQLIGPPLCGVIFEAMNVYGPLFNILGFFLIFGSSLGCCLPVIRRRQQSREELEQQIEPAEKLLA
ncbi:monocarboxylate transporter 12 [Culicoides brevitarsis]|uniref:monocarboxylate transporter 12 n=1 Tax=Culicoides brevitarsis TaxID=469753 RepID=UPI00307C61D6